MKVYDIISLYLYGGNMASIVLNAKGIKKSFFKIYFCNTRRKLLFIKYLLLKVFLIITALTSVAWSLATDHCRNGDRQTQVDNRNVNVYGTAQKV